MITNELNNKIKALNEADRMFFEEAFKNMTPPPDIRRAAERITRAYGIRGISDPGYIANVIALEIGRGDGKGSFFGNP